RRQPGAADGAQLLDRNGADGRQESRGAPRTGASGSAGLAPDPHRLRAPDPCRPGARRAHRGRTRGAVPLQAVAEVRIIAGEWRGRRLQAPGGQGARPTAARTPATLFSMGASRLGNFEGLRIADLYAGSGALGLEALSRGAAHATFVEQDREALRAIEANAATLGAASRAATS